MVSGLQKKSCKPICGIKPALRITTYPNKLRFVDENGISFRLPKQLSVKLNLLQQLEVIDENKADIINNMHSECMKTGLSTSNETSATASHFRSDNGQPKKAFDATNFQDALYDLKLKFPNHKCFAYKCAECNQIHIGKI